MFVDLVKGTAELIEPRALCLIGGLPLGGKCENGTVPW